MRGTAHLVDAAGNTGNIYFDAGDHVASQYGTTKSLGAWNGTTLSATFSDAFTWRPTAALPAGMTFTYSDAVGLRRLNIVLLVDSNGEGRGDSGDAPAVGHATQISPATYPHDRNHTGPGAPAVVGCAIMLADAILDRGHYDRVCIQVWSTGNQTVLESYGTDGTDGTYEAQMSHADAGAGPEGANPPPIMRPGDDAILVVVAGTNDAADPPADYADAATTLIAHVIETDWPSTNWLAVVQLVLPPTAPSGAHTAWATIRAAQPNVEAPSPVPMVNVALLDADRISGDEAHIATGTDTSAGWRRIVPAMTSGLVSAGAIE
jgi:hypothetical protein